jgi:microcin C transport system ATP-binding protein
MLLDIRDLNTWFEVDSSLSGSVEIEVLKNVSFSIGSGETVALVGESGSGKTVTALSILRLAEETGRVRQTGSITFENREIFTLAKEELRSLRGNRIAMIFQEPMTSLNPVFTIGNQLIEPLMLHRSMSKREATAEAIQLLARTGIDTPRERLQSYSYQLSGGQRQRVMIAMALACRPSLLIADEPTTALDVTVQAQILELLQDLQRELNMAILFITHDLPMVKKIAGTVHVMHRGTIIESGATAEIFRAPQQTYTKHLLNAIPAEDLRPVKNGPSLISTEGITCRFTLPGTTRGFFSRKVKVLTAVDNVSLTIAAGSTCGIVGESGSGKTTLGLAILRLVPSTGTILFNNHNLHELTRKAIRPLRKEMQIVFQDPFSSLSPRLTVAEIVEEGLLVHDRGLSASQRRDKVAKVLEEVGLESHMVGRYPHEFSGGQRQRIAIARVVILKPKFLVLDEPTSALDITIQAQIIALLKDLQEKYGMTYLFISHDLRVIRAMADQVAVMQHGRIIEAGPAREIFTSPRHDYTKTLFRAAL